MADERLEGWRAHFTPLQDVKTTPPEWVVPGLLPPGLVLLAGDPKTYKSFLAMCLCASITEGLPLAGLNGVSKPLVPKKIGTAAYFAPEQSAGSVRHIYETRVLKRKLSGPVSWNFIVAKNPWDWQLDEVDPEHDLTEFVGEMKPTLTIIDPLVYFHSLDENDPHLVKPLIPLREAALKHGVTVLVVHHARKTQAGSNQKGNPGAVDWSRIRGTSALWAAANGGLMTTRNPSGSVHIAAEFKDFPGSTWVWRPGGEKQLRKGEKKGL